MIVRLSKRNEGKNFVGGKDRVIENELRFEAKSVVLEVLHPRWVLRRLYGRATPLGQYGDGSSTPSCEIEAIFGKLEEGLKPLGLH